MVVGVVDRLEVVEVEERHGERSSRAFGAAQRPAEELVEKSPVGEPGEWVAGGLVGELGLQGSDLGDIAADAVQPVRGLDEAQLDHRDAAVCSSQRELDLRPEVPARDGVGEQGSTVVVERGTQDAEVGFDGRDRDTGELLERRAQVVDVRFWVAREVEDDVGRPVSQLPESRLTEPQVPTQLFVVPDGLLKPVHRVPQGVADAGRALALSARGCRGRRRRGSVLSCRGRLSWR